MCAAFRLAVGDRVQRLERRRDLAGRGDGDGELAVGHVRQRLGECLGAAEQEVEARLERRRQAPSHFRVRIGDGRSRHGEPRRRPEPHDQSSPCNPHVRPPSEAKNCGRRSIADRSRASFPIHLRSGASGIGFPFVDARRLSRRARGKTPRGYSPMPRANTRRPAPRVNRDALSPCGRVSRAPVRPGKSPEERARPRTSRP